MEPDKIFLFATAFQQELNILKPGWTLWDGEIHGPEGALIRFDERHPDTSGGHVDVAFIIDGRNPESPCLWDCICGLGSTLAERARFAAKLWMATSGGALLELKYSRKGEFADHFRGDEQEGLAGWHCICSAIIGYGNLPAAEALQKWWVSSQCVLPAIAPYLDPLAGDRPHAIKIFFGAQDIAEVRVDGEVLEEASAALKSLDWPRIDPAGLLRVFVIALHRE